ncbi:MAG: glycosyl hydrolase family 18 protein [Niabella sp.]
MKKMILAALCFTTVAIAHAQRYNAIAYYSGDSASLEAYDFNKITHIIYSFGHVGEEGRFVVEKKNAPATVSCIQKLKIKYPHLKAMVALGGWGGCEPCSGTFANLGYTKNFCTSVKHWLDSTGFDGFDIDWEYPVIDGFPGHARQPEDKENFTRLVRMLRETLGQDKLISFAAGGFDSFLEQSIDWKGVAGYVDFVNLMSYDLVGGFATVSGHHTNLYSTRGGEQSLDNAMKYFKKIKFPLRKVNAGAAFYTREFETETEENKGLYQPCTFRAFIGHREADTRYSPDSGFIKYWDDKAKAAYWFHPEKKTFVTGDDAKSVKEKCRYVKKHKLAGIMYWELICDKPEKGLYTMIAF